MCNRYSAAQREAIRVYGKDIVPYLTLEEWQPIYNIPPKSFVPAIVAEKEKPGRLLQWGTDSINGFLMNARSETMLEKPLWKSSALKRRCLMLADGFFEWETIGRKKLGHYLSLLDRKPFAIAGIWLPANEQQPDRVAMVTCEPNSLVQPFHDRMPVILNPTEAKTWLTLDSITSAEVKSLCRTYPSDAMHHWRSPPEMNSNSFQEPAANQPWQPEPDLFG